MAINLCVKDGRVLELDGMTTEQIMFELAQDLKDSLFIQEDDMGTYLPWDGKNEVFQHWKESGQEIFFHTEERYKEVFEFLFRNMVLPEPPEDEPGVVHSLNPMTNANYRPIKFGGYFCDSLGIFKNDTTPVLTREMILKLTSKEIIRIVNDLDSSEAKGNTSAQAYLKACHDAMLQLNSLSSKNHEKEIQRKVDSLAKIIRMMELELNQ